MSFNLSALLAFEEVISNVKGKKGKTTLNVKINDANKRTLSTDRADFSSDVKTTAKLIAEAADAGGAKYSAKIGVGVADKTSTKEVGRDHAATLVYMLTGEASSVEEAYQMAVRDGAIIDGDAQRKTDEKARKAINDLTDNLLAMAKTRGDVVQGLSADDVSNIARSIAADVFSGLTAPENGWKTFENTCKGQREFREEEEKARQKMAEEMAGGRNMPVADTNGAPVKPNGRGKKAGAAAD